MYLFYALVIHRSVTQQTKRRWSGMKAAGSSKGKKLQKTFIYLFISLEIESLAPWRQNIKKWEMTSYFCCSIKVFCGTFIFISSLNIAFISGQHCSEPRFKQLTDCLA